MTPPLAFTWPYAVAFGAVYAWTFVPEFRIVRQAAADARRPDSLDAGSYRLIRTGSGLANMAAFNLAFVRGWQVASPWREWWFGVGLVVIVLGSLLRRHCWSVLGEHFKGAVTVRADQPVIDRGAYRLIRHPSYLAALVLYLGVGLTLGSWASLGLLVVTTFPIYHYRMNVEERALEAVLGERYTTFKRGRQRLVPFVY